MQSMIFRKAFSRILLSAGLAASLVACKKDKDNAPGTVDPPKARLAVYSNGEDYVKFDYNTDGSVKKLSVKTDDVTYGNELVFQVSYDNQKRISKLESDWKTISVEYENNSMSRARIFEYEKQIGYTNYQYVSGNLARATLYFGESGVFVPTIEYNMTYTAQGNLSETVIMLATEPNQMKRSGSITYQYDQKTNPLYEHRQLLAILWQSVPKNNITLENHLDADQQPEDKYQYTYTYNAKGFPEKAAVRQGLPGEDQVDSEIKFTYK